MTADEQLERETAARRWAVPAAILAALIPLVGAVLGATASRHDKSADDTGRLLFIHDHAGGLILSGIVQALGYVFVGLTLYFLYDAVRFRRPELPPLARVASVLGPALLLVCQIGLVLVLAHQANRFAMTKARTFEDAKPLFHASSLRAFQYGGLLGGFILAFAFVVISLNSIRVGLLTRFMGTLGIILGVLSAIPQLFPVPIIQTFWFGALALLIAGRWPSGMPPAWVTGRAEPWPSQQELREARDRDRGGGKEGAVRPTPEPAAATPVGTPHPTSKKRKRKRRR